MRMYVRMGLDGLDGWLSYVSYSKSTFGANKHLFLSICDQYQRKKISGGKATLPKAKWTQALTALTSNFGLAWFGRFGTVSLVG